VRATFIQKLARGHAARRLFARMRAEEARRLRAEAEAVRRKGFGVTRFGVTRVDSRAVVTHAHAPRQVAAGVVAHLILYAEEMMDKIEVARREAAATLIKAVYRGHAVRELGRKSEWERAHLKQEKRDTHGLLSMLDDMSVQRQDFVTDELDGLKLEARTIASVAKHTAVVAVRSVAPRKRKPRAADAAAAAAAQAEADAAEAEAKAVAHRRWEDSENATAASRIPAVDLKRLRNREARELLLAGHKLRAQVTVHPSGDSSPGLVTVCPSAQASCAQDAATIAAFLSRNRPGILERIDLDRNPLVGPTGLSALAQAIPGTALRSLSLAGSQVCGVAVADAARNQALWMHDATAVEELADIRPGPPAAPTRL
jgi:hypothetical protein